MSKKHRLKTEDVRKMTGEELSVELEAQRSKLFTARSQSVTEKVEDLSLFGEHKRNIARLLTEQNARRPRAEAKAAPAAAAAPAKKPAARKPAAAKAGARKPAANTSAKAATK
jgi:ribosomal protein L29